MQEERRTSQSETRLGEVWKVALSPFAFGAEMVSVEGPQRRTKMMERMQQEVQEKKGQMRGGDSTKEEAAKRRRQD